MVMSVGRTSTMPSAKELLTWWDEADDRAVRATLVPLLRRVVHEPQVEDRMVRDYLYSLRAGDRHLAAILEGGSARVVAAYVQVILRRMRRGQGLARYAVRHLARRTDGVPLLRGVVASEQFGLSDVLVALDVRPDREMRIRSLGRLARQECLPPLLPDELQACLAHPDAAVRRLAEQRWEDEGWGPVAIEPWPDALARWGIDDIDDAEVIARAEAWGQQLLDAHGDWLHTLKGVRAPVEEDHRRSLATVEAGVRQRWSDELVRFEVTAAPLRSRPRLAVTFRDAQGCIVDITTLPPVRFADGTVWFEAWRVGRWRQAVSAEATVRFGR